MIRILSHDKSQAVNGGKWRHLKIIELGFLDGFQIGSIIMLGKYKLSFFIKKGGDAAGILPDVPEVRIVQPQQCTN